MSFLPKCTLLGRLELVEVYEFYDRPVLFSCVNASGQIYIAVWSDENEDFDTWLYARVSQNRFEQIRAGEIDLHDTFSQTEDGTLLEVRISSDEGHEEVDVSSISADSVEERYLPARDELLNLESADLSAIPNSLAHKAIQSGREFVNLRLNFYQPHRGEAPAGGLGKVLSSLQATVDAIGEAIRGEAGERGKISADILRQSGLSVVRVGPGSFVVELASSEPVGEYDFSPAGEAIREFVELLDKSEDFDELAEALKQLSPRVAKRYRAFLKHVGDEVADTSVEWASPTTRRSRSTSLNALRAISAGDFIEQMEETDVKMHTVRGVLIGANIRTKRFEIFTRERNYAGEVSDEVFEVFRKATLSRQYKAQIRETVKTKPATGTTKSRFSLVSLETYETEEDHP